MSAFVSIFMLFFAFVFQLVRNFELEYKHEEMDCFTRLINVPDKPLKLTFIDRS